MIYSKEMLSGAVATGVSVTEEIIGTGVRFVLQVATTGTPTTASVQAESSLDGAVWTPIDGLGLTVGTSTGAGFSGTVSTEVGIPVKYVRLNLDTLTGGSSPTVDALLVAHE